MIAAATMAIPPRNFGLLLARVGIGAWGAFWSWFTICDLASEGVAWQPIAILAALLGTSVAGCLRPRLGGWLCAAFGAVSAWVFADATAIAIFSAPALVFGVAAALLAAPPRTR